MSGNPEANSQSDYRAARKAFIAACEKARADTISRVHPGRAGPDGKPLFIDSVALGPRDAKKALLVIANSAAASSAMTALLQDGVTIAEGTRLVLVHALDPFGFAGRPGDPAWSQAMLRAIATEDLSRVTDLTVLGFGATEDKFPAIFAPDRKVRLTWKQADAEPGALPKMVRAELSRL